jgi:hypothetical protein
VQELAEVVLSEPFIAQKLIRAANVVLNRRGIGPVTTISRAIVLLGLDQVRMLAVSTLLVERLTNSKQAKRVHEEFSKALYAATLAQELAAGRAGLEPEEAAVCALFRGLGRLVAVLYLYEPYEEALTISWHEGLSASHAAVRTLGMSFAQLGVEVLKRWGMPERIIQAALPCPLRLPASAGPTSSIRILAEFCMEVAEAACEPRPLLRRRQADQLIDRFGEALGLSRGRLGESLRRADAHTLELNPALGLAARVIASDLIDSNNPLTLSPANRPSPELTLGAGIASLSRMLEQGASAQLRLQHAADVLQRAFDFQRVVLCVKHPASAVFAIRLAAGKMPHTTQAQLELAHAGHQDLFQVATARQADIYIRDATDPKLQASLPQWFKSAFPDAKSFLLLPVGDSDGSVGFFYADHGRANVQGLTGEEMRLLKTLKQAIRSAVRQEQAAVDGAIAPALPPQSPDN